MCSVFELDPNVSYYAFVSESLQATWIFGDPFMFKIVKVATSVHTAWSVVKNVFGMLVKETLEFKESKVFSTKEIDKKNKEPSAPVSPL